MGKTLEQLNSILMFPEPALLKKGYAIINQNLQNNTDITLETANAAYVKEIIHKNINIIKLSQNREGRY
jgi:serine protease inhibitor